MADCLDTISIVELLHDRIFCGKLRFTSKNNSCPIGHFFNNGLLGNRRLIVQKLPKLPQYSCNKTRLFIYRAFHNSCPNFQIHQENYEGALPYSLTIPASALLGDLLHVLNQFFFLFCFTRILISGVHFGNTTLTVELNLEIMKQ